MGRGGRARSDAGLMAGGLYFCRVTHFADTVRNPGNPMLHKMNTLHVWRRLARWLILMSAGAAALSAATRFELDGSFGLPVFTRPATGPVRATPLADGGALVEGTFAQVNGQEAQRIWRLDAQGAVVNADFGAGRGATNGDFSRAVQLRDGRVLLAPPSASPGVATPARLRVTRAVPSGEVEAGYALDCVATGTESAVLTGFFVLPDGRVMVTGNFSSVGGHATKDVARLTAAGEVDPGFVSEVDFTGPITVSADGMIVGMAPPPQTTLQPVAPLPPRLVRLGADGAATEVWTLPVDALYGAPLLAVDASDRVLVAINRPGTVVYAAPTGGIETGAAGLASLLPIWPGPTANGFTVYRYQTGVEEGAVLYASPVDSTDTGSGGIAVQSGLSVNGMNATAEGGVLLRGTMPRSYAEQPDGLLPLRADGTVDTGFVATGLVGLRVTDLQAVADGWLATGQLPGSLGASQQLRKLDPALALRADFSANLRQIALVEAALTLPDGSVLVRGTFSRPTDAVQRYVRVRADGTVDFDHVPQATGVATLGQDGRIYLGGWPRGAQYLDLGNVLESVVPVAVGPTPAGDNNVLRFSADGVPDVAFGPRALAATQLTAVWADGTGRALLGGYDQATGAKRVAKVARLQPGGEPDATFAPQLPTLNDGMVRSVAGLPGGAGYGWLIGAQARIVALDTSGRLITTGSGVGVNYTIDGAVALVATGGMTFAVGSFQSVLGVASPGIVRLGADGLPDPNWHSGLPVNSAVSDVQMLADGRLLVSGLGPAVVLNADGSPDRNETLPPNATAIAPLGDGSLLVFLPDGTTQRWRQVTREDVTLTGAAPGRIFHPEERVTLTAALPAGPGTVTWLHDGVVIPGATTATLDIAAATLADAGVYTVRWASGGGTVEQAVRVAVQPAGSRIVNVSARSLIGTGDAVQITGFVATGTSARPVLARSVRGGLAQLGVGHPATGRDWDVFLNGRQTYHSTYMGYPIYTGTEAIEDTVLRAGAFGLPDLATNSQAQFALQPGQSYAIMVAATPAEAGIGLSELYVPLDENGTPAGVRLKNFSCRALSGPGEGILIAGFVVAGDRPLPLLICGRGPGLVRYGVTGAIEDPAITLYRGPDIVAANDDWETQADPAAVTAAVARVGAGELTPGAKDAALYVQLAPGAYTVLLDPKSAALRVGMIELFDAGE